MERGGRNKREGKWRKRQGGEERREKRAVREEGEKERGKRRKGKGGEERWKERRIEMILSQEKGLHKKYSYVSVLPIEQNKQHSSYMV